MTQCHTCGYENSVSRERCEKCGTMLNAQSDKNGIPDDAERIGKEMQMRDDGKTNLLDETVIQPPVPDADSVDNNEAETAEAGSAQQEVVTDDSTHATALVPHMDDEDGLLHIGSVRFQGNLLLRHEETGRVFRIENENLTEAVVGRFNKRTGFKPNVDLSEVDGENRGVSRRHATINQRGELIFVTDHNSLNGTFLNGQRLVPEQSRVMRDSDTLRIGHVTLTVVFDESDL